MEGDTLILTSERGHPSAARTWCVRAIGPYQVQTKEVSSVGGGERVRVQSQVILHGKGGTP